MPKQRPSDAKNWQKVSDTTGRGYGYAAQRQTPGCVSNAKAREQLPRPTMETLLTQNAASLDHENRFFEDTRKRMGEMLVYDYGHGQPQYSDKKVLASKVTSREFIKMPKAEVPVPVGYREAVVPAHERNQIKSAMKQTQNASKRKGTKQVSEVDEQDSSKQTRSAAADFQTPAAATAQIEEKMQKQVQIEAEQPASSIAPASDAHQLA